MVNIILTFFLNEFSEMTNLFFLALMNFPSLGSNISKFIFGNHKCKRNDAAYNSCALGDFFSF